MITNTSNNISWNTKRHESWRKMTTDQTFQTNFKKKNLKKFKAFLTVCENGFLHPNMIIDENI